MVGSEVKIGVHGARKEERKTRVTWTSRGGHSFPFLSFSRQMLIVAFIWIVVAIAWNTIRVSIARKATRD